MELEVEVECEHCGKMMTTMIEIEADEMNEGYC